MTKIVFFGTEEFSAPTLRELVKRGHDIATVVTKPDTPRGRGRKIESPLVKEIADSQNIPVIQPNRIIEVLTELQQFDAKIGILISYGKIVPQAVIDVFPRGIINVHPSLLPKYRGPSPIETAIANGDHETGISIMSVTLAMDSGPVYIQKKVPLRGTETKLELYDRFSTLGAELLCDNLPRILSGEIVAEPQDDSAATYCQLLTRADGQLDPTTMTADECERKVRAYLGWPRTRLSFLGREIIVTQAHIEEHESEHGVQCADDRWLVIDELIAPSGKQMKTADYLRGLK